ncbi:hypothetical protein CA54_38300 [Symmachiella macrocystis]|uniref:Uncharacterized protein n=1 Tax=Symmachiella macrocystis TaxID=2527985 RepID=A0A5C6BRT8_9PLAN|nr:hypothetical protein CA54_38300 [Symmachiella macrocystis]
MLRLLIPQILLAVSRRSCVVAPGQQSTTKICKIRHGETVG